MTEEQQKLQKVLNNRKAVLEDMQKLQAAFNERQQVLIKIEGALEAFATLGITLPEETEEA